MSNNHYKEYRDASWDQVSKEGQSYDSSCISFRNTRGYKIKRLFKGIAFILVAAVSGGATSYFMIQKKYDGIAIAAMPNNPSLLEQKSNTTATMVLPKNTITKVAEAVGPTVVGISNNAQTFFGNKIQSAGSGIIFDKQGYIVTNYHVIQGADSVSVKLPNSSKVFDAKFVGAEPTRDIAVIKIEAEDLPVAKFGDSSSIKVGDVAVAIGNPLGQEFAGSVTAGIISATNREIEMQDEDTGRVTTYKVLQTDAAINPGNSGGALCNEAGEIIGICSLKIKSQGAEGMGFAITINEANEIIARLMGQKPVEIKQGIVDAPNVMLGITGEPVVAEDDFGVKGVYIIDVEAGAGADKAGIRPADIIVEVASIKVSNSVQIQDSLRNYKAGDKVNVKLWRNGKYMAVEVTLSARTK